MPSQYDANDVSMTHPIKTGNVDTPQMAAAIVVGALVFLILVRRGFRGVSVGKATGGILRG